jgi:hypothetical protein
MKGWWHWPRKTNVPDYTNYMQFRHAWDIDSYYMIMNFLAFHTSQVSIAVFTKSTPLVFIPDQISPVCNVPPNLYLYLLCGLFLSRFSIETFHAIFFCPSAFYIIAHLIFLLLIIVIISGDGIQTMKLLIVQFSLKFCHFVSLTSKYSTSFPKEPLLSMWDTKFQTQN